MPDYCREPYQLTCEVRAVGANLNMHLAVTLAVG
jgi:hypothetical protein